MDSAKIDPLPPEKNETSSRKPWRTPKVLLGTVSTETWSSSHPLSDNAAGFGTHS